MRFLRLDLRAFGPFADAPPIPLDRGNHGLHLIHGPNEAGKSSALRAIRCLLFGFPARTSDDHRHAYKDLRVGATIRGVGGTELAFLRRKGDVRTIRTPDDDEAIADDVLSRCLGGIDRAKFDDLFAMDHAELVAGGLSILQGKGNLGSVLFAAGSGLARVDEVRKSLEAEIDELFKPRASNPSINAEIARLKAARDASEKAMLATSAWVELDATLARERARKEAIEGEIRSAEAEKRRLERLRDALPVIARRAARLGQLADLGNAPVLSDGFADRRREATVDQQVGIKAGLAAGKALEAVDLTIDEFGPRDTVLDEAEAIRRARDDLGLYRKALEGRPAEQARLARREADARALIAELRPGAPIEEAERLRVPAGSKEQIQALAQEFARLDTRCATAEAEVAKLGNGQGPSHPSPTPDARRLARVLADEVSRVQGLGDLEGQLAKLRLDLTKAEQQAEVDLRTLPLWSGSLDDLEALKAPSTATLDRFDSDFRAAEDKFDRAGDALATAEAERAAIDREIDRERIAGSVPTEEELADRRGRRDDGWRLIRRGWLGDAPVENPSGVADDFEAAVRSADEIADRLRREADAVAEQAQRDSRRRELVDRINALAEARDRADRDRAAIRQSWVDAWKPIGLDPLPPREMKDWITIHRADLVRQARGLRDRRADIADREAKVEEIKAELGRHLAKLGEPVDDPPGSLAALLGVAKATVDRVGEALGLEAARATLAKAEAARDAWKSRWASAVGPLGLLDDASPTQALAIVGRFDDLAALLREIADLRSKIEEQARVEARFEADVRSLVDRLAPELSDAPIDPAARQLANRYDGAQVVEVLRGEALKRQKDEQAKLDEARAAVDRADLAIEALVSEAGCGSPDALIEAERVSDAIKELKKELRAFDEQLATLAGPISPEQLREQAEGADPDALEVRIAELADQLAPLEAERDRLGEEIGRCRQRLDAMDGGPAAADAQQGVEERVAHLALDVERYARLRLASAVLRESVDRYRKEHQGPVLERAGSLFESLTAGSFAGLRADVDDKGQPVLLGVRADGSTLQVDGMSEGTADQLYLALRLASLQTYLDAHEPMPLVVDDILVNFDNARALAALQALAELSKRTQVLFFTHHEHLVDLARAALGPDVLFVHHLDFPPVSVPVNGHAEGSPIEAAKPKRKKKAATVTEEG